MIWNSTFPEGVQLTSIFLDDHPLSLMPPVNGRLKIPLADSGTESLLTLTWNIDAKAANQQRRQAESFPWPREVRVERNLVTMLPDDRIAILLRSGLQSIDSLDQSLDWLDTLLDRHAALGADTRAALANRWLIDQTQRRVSLRLPQIVQNRSEQVQQQLTRWKGIVNRINQLERVPLRSADQLAISTV